jgi:serine/threonine-protein kinase HipA
MDMEAFFALHCDLPREGPGNDASTREAIRRLPPLGRTAGEQPRILDLGCGPGRQTLVLARELNLPVTAIDVHEPFLDRLRRAARAAGLDHLITARRAGMEALAFPPGSVDLIWAEGSIFVIGFATGLSLWRPILRDGGIIVASELTWLTTSPAAEAAAFWREGYPPMTTVEDNIASAAAIGMEVFDHFVLPRAAWWDDYLGPLEARVAALRQQAGPAGPLPELAAVLDEADREIDLVRRHGDSFGYVFYLMRKSSVPCEKGCMHEHH